MAHQPAADLGIAVVCQQLFDTAAGGLPRLTGGGNGSGNLSGTVHEHSFYCKYSQVEAQGGEPILPILLNYFSQNFAPLSDIPYNSCFRKKTLPFQGCYE